MLKIAVGVVFLTTILFCAGCVREQSPVIVITATFLPPTEGAAPLAAATNQPAAPQNDSGGIVITPPTPDPTRPAPILASADEHVVQTGETLFGIASLYNIRLDDLIALNQLANPNLLTVGQVLKLPAPPDQETPSQKLIADGRFVRGPDSIGFDTEAFLTQQFGFIRNVVDEVSTNQADGDSQKELLTAAQVIDRAAFEYGVDPRLLLTMLELRAKWLSQAIITEELSQYPLISDADSNGIDRRGLYKQLAWAANELNRGYYDWKYGGESLLLFEDGTRLNYAGGLNAGTVGIQYFLSLNQAYPTWLQDLDTFYATYLHYFGDPFAVTADPLVPDVLIQPELTLPFTQGETWFFTGGAHGGWGSGSAWGAVDFAPPDERLDGAAFCYVSEYWVTAVAQGIIAYSDGGVVVLDLDGDGELLTGWTVLYLHLASQDRIQAGIFVNSGDPIGKASCEGGFSTATHMHIARRFNGEWLPVDCPRCPPERVVPSFVMGGWQISGIEGQQYQGYMQNGATVLQAEQGRQSLVNRVTWR